MKTKIIKEAIRELEDKKIKLNNLEVEINEIKESTLYLEQKIKDLKIRPKITNLFTSGTHDIHYYNRQTIEDTDGHIMEKMKDGMEILI